MQCATWMECLQDGVRQTYELMTVVCWPLAVTMLLMGGPLRPMETNSNYIMVKGCQGQHGHLHDWKGRNYV